MITTIDIETTMTFGSNTVSSPFFGNQIVFVGIASEIPGMYSEEMEVWLHHDAIPATKDAAPKIQSVLDKTSCLIGHNLKFDLQWLRACGFKYDGHLFDTMISEYLLARGNKVGLSLAACCERRGLSEKRTDLTSEYIKNKISYESMPPHIVNQYCMNDVRITKQLADMQISEFNMSWDDYEPSSVYGDIHAKCA